MNIIAGRLQQQDQVKQAVDRLIGAGFDENRISAFFVNPAGRHDIFPIGGDRDRSPGAKETGVGIAKGATAGGVVGAVAGIAAGTVATPIVGPASPAVGTLVGAHLGGLVGTLSKLKDKGEDEVGDENAEPHRQSGMVVAVATEPTKEQAAIAVLQDIGADQIERAEGTISNGDWSDFDPLASPQLL